jgi:hypothetical protein
MEMWRFIWLFTIFMLALPSVVDARHRTHVTITKQYQRPVQQPIIITVPVLLVPPLGMFYDLARRTSCQGDTLGLGGPGFSSAITPATGNVMTTAYMRGECPGIEPR